MVLRSRWTLMTVKLEDKDGALKVAHHHLFKRYPLDKLGRKFKSSGRSMPLSLIWRNFECYLWAVCGSEKTEGEGSI